MVGGTGGVGDGIQFNLDPIFSDDKLTSQEIQDTIGQSDPTEGFLSGFDRSNRIPILVATKVWDQGRNELESAIKEAQLADIDLIINLFSSLLREAENLADLNLLIVQAAQKWVRVSEAHNEEITNINIEISSLNQATQANATLDNNRTQNLNDAIDQYNAAYADYINNPNATTEAALNAAIANYNSKADVYTTHITSRNASIQSYNDAVAAYNATLAGDVSVDTSAAALAVVNAERASFGLDTLDPNAVRVDANGDPVFLEPAPLLPVLGDPGNPPASISSGSPVPTITALPYPPEIQTFNQPELALIEVSETFEAIRTAFVTILNSLLEGFTSFRDLFDRVARQIDLNILFGRAANRITLADILDRNPDLSQSEPTGPGGSLGFSGYRLDQNVPASVERILGDGLFSATSQEYGVELSDPFFARINTSLLQLQFSTGIISSYLSVQTIGGLANLSPQNTPFRIAQDAIALQNFSRIVSSGQIEELVRNLLEQELEGAGGLSPEAFNELVTRFSAIFALSLLGSGLVDLTLNLGLPGLVAQLLANVSGLSVGEARLAVNTSSTLLRQILESPISIAELENAIPGIGQAILSIDQNIALMNFEELKALLSGQLEEQQGLTPAEADRQAEIALALIQGNANDTIVDIPLQDVEADAIARILEEQANAIEENGERIREEILDLLRTEDFNSVRELRAGIFRRFLDVGLSAPNAVFLGNQAANFLVLGETAPVTGIASARLNDLQNIVDNDLINETLGQGPFASEQEFLFALRNRFAGAGRAGEIDTAISGFIGGGGSVTTPGLGGVLSTGAIADEVRQSVISRTSADIGEDNAEVLASEVVAALFGTEQKDPNSTLNLVDQEIRAIRRTEETESTSRTSEELNDLLRSMNRPSAEQGFVIQKNISDGPSTVILNLAAAGDAVKLGDTLMRG